VLQRDCVDVGAAKLSDHSTQLCLCLYFSREFYFFPATCVAARQGWHD